MTASQISSFELDLKLSAGKSKAPTSRAELRRYFGVMMDIPDRKLFDPAAMPARDEHGMCFHPDLLSDRWNDDVNEEAYDRAKFAEAGFEIDLIEFEREATKEQIDAWFKEGDVNLTSWTPSVPCGDGWMLAGIGDAEYGPVALYVREVLSA